MSNTHSLVNLLTRFVKTEEKHLLEYLYNTKNDELIRQWEMIKSGDFLANKEHFLYYIAKKYSQSHPAFITRIRARQKHMSIRYIPATFYLDIDAQIIEMRKLAGADL